MTTTAFRIDLIEPAIGINRLMSQRRTPTTIRTTTTLIKGMINTPPYSCFQKRAKEVRSSLCAAEYGRLEVQARRHIFKSAWCRFLRVTPKVLGRLKPTQ
jgi:hypothetical protein